MQDGDEEEGGRRDAADGLRRWAAGVAVHHRTRRCDREELDVGLRKKQWQRTTKLRLIPPDLSSLSSVQGTHRRLLRFHKPVNHGTPGHEPYSISSPLVPTGKGMDPQSSNQGEGKKAAVRFGKHQTQASLRQDMGTEENTGGASPWPLKAAIVAQYLPASRVRDSNKF